MGRCVVFVDGEYLRKIFAKRLLRVDVPGKAADDLAPINFNTGGRRPASVAGPPRRFWCEIGLSCDRERILLREPSGRDPDRLFTGRGAGPTATPAGTFQINCH